LGNKERGDVVLAEIPMIVASALWIALHSTRNYFLWVATVSSQFELSGQEEASLDLVVLVPSPGEDTYSKDFISTEDDTKSELLM
jgi:hypothetical protein